ncbi:MAG: YciI family protein [Gammaproteobacteria bacterium]
MLYAIHCLDHADKLQARLDHYPEHRAYLNSVPLKIVLAGPIAADDGETPIGSVMIIDAATRAEAEAFNRNDPFYQLGVWNRAAINIHVFLKRRGWLAEY